MTKELTFSKIEGGNGYEAIAAVNGDFNIHLERNDSGIVLLYQSTVDGAEKALQFSTGSATGEVWEEDFDNIVYPKYIRVVSGSMVRKGYITEVEE